MILGSKSVVYFQKFKAFSPIWSHVNENEKKRPRGLDALLDYLSDETSIDLWILAI